MGTMYYSTTVAQGANFVADGIQAYLNCIEWIGSIPGIELVNEYNNAEYVGTAEYLYLHTFSCLGDTTTYVAFGCKKRTAGSYSYIDMYIGHTVNPEETAEIYNSFTTLISQQANITNSYFTVLYGSNSFIIACSNSNIISGIPKWPLSTEQDFGKLLGTVTTKTDGTKGYFYVFNNRALSSANVYFDSSVPVSTKQLGNILYQKTSTNQSKAFITNALIMTSQTNTDFETCDGIYQILAADVYRGNKAVIDGKTYALFLENLAIEI